MSAKYDQVIYDIAIKNGFNPVSAKLVVAQARFESADYTSNVFKKNLNTSGMKYARQPLATQGTLSPEGDYYAKFASVEDSAKDKIERLFSITRKGITPKQLKEAKTPEEFAKLQKIRGYYGDKESTYARGLRAKLNLIKISEFVEKNKTTILLVSGIVVLALSYYLYSKKG